MHSGHLMEMSQEDLLWQWAPKPPTLISKMKERKLNVWAAINKFTIMWVNDNAVEIQCNHQWALWWSIMRLQAVILLKNKVISPWLFQPERQHTIVQLQCCHIICNCTFVAFYIVVVLHLLPFNTICFCLWSLEVYYFKLISDTGHIPFLSP